MSCPARIIIDDHGIEINCALDAGHIGDCGTDQGVALDVAAILAVREQLGYDVCGRCNGNGWVGVRGRRALKRCPSCRPDAS